MRLPMLPVADSCAVCSATLVGGDGESVCEDCTLRSRPAFERSACALRYEGAARELVRRFKFRRAFHWRDDFADFMEAAVSSRFEAAAIDAVAPVPMAFWHRWNRGYSPAAILARALAARLERRYEGGALGRIGHPRRQSELPAAERRTNVIGTFAVRRPEWVRGRTLLVVDDIMTTGATLSECARVLLAAGAERVWVATLARTPRD